MDVVAAFTHTNAVDAYRGAGRPEATYMIERLVDLAALELGERSGRAEDAELYSTI